MWMHWYLEIFIHRKFNINWNRSFGWQLGKLSNIFFMYLCENYLSYCAFFVNFEQQKLKKDNIIILQQYLRKAVN